LAPKTMGKGNSGLWFLLFGWVIIVTFSIVSPPWRHFFPYLLQPLLSFFCPHQKVKRKKTSQQFCSSPFGNNQAENQQNLQIITFLLDFIKLWNKILTFSPSLYIWYPIREVEESDLTIY
jgi:hypothetical protein